MKLDLAPSPFTSSILHSSLPTPPSSGPQSYLLAPPPKRQRTNEDDASMSDVDLGQPIKFEPLETPAHNLPSSRQPPPAPSKPKRVKASPATKTKLTATPKAPNRCAPKAPVPSSDPPSTPTQPRTTDAPSPWTIEQKSFVLNRILTVGIKAVDFRTLAAETGVNVQQLQNMLRTGRKGNLRDRAMRSVTE